MALSVAIEEKQLKLEIVLCGRLTKRAEHLDIPIGDCTDKSWLVVTGVF